jgi:hypothetical protein
MERPLSHHDLRTLAEYLHGTRRNLQIAASELGFDPSKYPLRRWLAELHLHRDETGRWYYEVD